MKRLLLAGITSLVFLVTLATPARAHPLGNFTINQYLGLHLREDGVTVDFVIDMAEIPTVQERVRLDADGDGDIGPAERASYAEELCGQVPSALRIATDGTDLHLDATSASVSLLPGQAGLNTLRLECAFKAELPSSVATIQFENLLYEDRLGWREVVVTGFGVAFATDLPQRSITDRLRAYPEDLLRSPLDIREGSISIGETVGTRSEPSPAREAPRRLSIADGLPVTGLFALVGAFGLGLGHALAPGHGKAAIAAYLVGSRGNLTSGLVLGLAVAVAHTAGVAMLGVVVFTAAATIHPETLFPYLSAASGVIVFAIGVALGIRRLHQGHHHHREHHPTLISGRSVIALGLANGMVPSASAVLLLLAAIHVGRPGWGLLLTGAFGLGMAVTLAGVGLGSSLIAGRGLTWTSRLGHRLGHRFEAVLPLVMALVVVGAGTAMTVRGLSQIMG